MRILFDIANFGIIQLLVFGGLFVGIFYFTSYNDGSHIKKAIEDIESNIQKVSKQNQQKQKEIQDVKMFEKEIMAQEKDVKFLLDFIPKSLTYTDISNLLITTANRSGVNIDVKQDQKVESREDSEYHILSIQLAVSGAFSHILLFLSKLTDQRRMLIVNNVTMRVERETQLIKADLNISAYRYKELDKKQTEEEGAEQESS